MAILQLLSMPLFCHCCMAADPVPVASSCAVLTSCSNAGNQNLDRMRQDKRALSEVSSRVGRSHGSPKISFP
eukprot:3354219-Amphidinium_carterae.1